MFELNWGELSPEQFLKDYWQKKPLLIRQAFPDFESIIAPDELAGLSCEEGVESRILIEQGLDKQTPWQVIHGPQQENIFEQLPKTNWTLLVQEANQYLDELGELIDCFNFIPNWRFDDVMISYAPKHGSVGPHTDQYDVFLLQAYGQRHWHIADYPTTDSDLIENIESKILKELKPEQDWVLNPGDLLYLPPNIIHHGIALNDCLTYSFGYRAPTAVDTLSSIIEFLDDNEVKNYRYVDPDLKLNPHGNGEITREAFQHLINNMRGLLNNEEKIRELLACYLTDTPHQLYLTELDFHSPEQLLDYLKQGNQLQRSEAARIAFTQKNNGTYQFFMNGDKVETAIEVNELIPIICGERFLTIKKVESCLNDKSQEFLFKLIKQGIYH
ncbi:MAG: cupin domain-containing protein [Gammaproteobacteria bacterium]|nr:cupin domain-containing protein [Gammaproteobacteria bacterium]